MSASATVADGDAAGPPDPAAATRKEKRRERKKERRRKARREAAARARAAAEADALPADPEEERRLREQEEAEAAAESERARRAFEDAERRWLEAAAARAAEKAAAAAAAEEARAAEASAREKVSSLPPFPCDPVISLLWLLQSKDDQGNEPEEDDDEWEYIEDGPAEIIWQGNEIIVKKKKVKVPKGVKEKPPVQEDKAHCPFHLKTGACRFGVRCSRVHFYPDNSSTLLMKNMYNGPGLALEQDEGLEFTDEEIEQSYEEFYEDVHTEFLKFGELVNFKITCEFVAVTRWKAAICGEYMRSRYKTCSHGVACNFIHCFRNPGGDYEWADWDNPPPRYWVRKMAALFGPAVDTSKASDTPDFGRPQPSDRKRLKNSSDRYVSRRSMGEGAHTRYSSHDYSHSKHEHSSQRLNYGYSRHRRGSSAADRHQAQDTVDPNGRQLSTTGSENQPHKHNREERHRSDHGDGGKYDDKIRSSKHRSDWRGSCEPGSSDWPSDLSDTEVRKGPSGSKSSNRYDEHKKSRRKSSKDHNFERHYTVDKLAGKKHRMDSKRGRVDDYHDEKDGRRGKSRKHKDDHNYSNDRWVATYSDVDSDDGSYQRSSSEGTEFGRKGDAHSDADARHRRSSSRTKDDKTRRKSHSGNKQRSTTEEDTTDSDSRDLSSDSWSRRSRSSEENFSRHRSKRKRHQIKDKSSS
nr:unnamed protein product [Digitaria exilis]